MEDMFEKMPLDAQREVLVNLRMWKQLVKVYGNPEFPMTSILQEMKKAVDDQLELLHSVAQMKENANKFRNSQGVYS